jgi:hypothetical protein
MAQNQAAPSVKVVITGISGSGKSTLFEKLVRRESAEWVFLFCHKDGDMARRFKVKAAFDENQLIEATARGGVVVYDYRKMFPGDAAAGFAWFCSWLWAVKSELPGRKILGADELDALVDSKSEPESLCLILDQGRTFEIECFFIAHAMNGVHNQVRKQFTEIFVMLQGDKNGLVWLQERGFSAEEIAGLRHGQWLYCNRNTGQRARGGSAFVPKNSGRNLKGL